MDAAEAVGVVVGTAIVLGPFIALAVWAILRSTWEPRYLKALDADNRRKARRLLDRYAKARKPRSLPGHRQMMQRSRYVGLWLLGELDELRAELAKHDGKGSASYVANVTMFGVLALAVETADDAELANLTATLDALAAKVARDATRLLRSTSDLAASVATVGGALGGRPIGEADAVKFHGYSFSASRLSRILMLRVLVVVAERAGKPGLRFQRMLAGMTRRFAAPPPAA